MPVCSICLQDRRLTRAHVFPDALADKILRGKKMVFTEEQGFFASNDFTVNDECKECQQKSAQVFDDRVKEVLSTLSTLDVAAPTTIEVEEPWFTLYCLRIQWAAHRGGKDSIVIPEARESVRNYILECRTDFPEGMHGRVKIFFCQEPSEIKYKKTRIPMNQSLQSSAGKSTSTPDGQLTVYDTYLGLARLRVHIYSVHQSLANDPLVLEFWKLCETLGGEVPSLFLTGGRQKYVFKRFCSRSTNPTQIKDHINYMSRQAKTRTKSRYKK